MTFVSTDKMKLSVLIVSFLLLVSAFTFLPAVGAYSPSSVAKIGSAPASVAGATATIDYPILAGYSVAVTRTISLSNPIGNTPISTFTISIPKAAASVAPTGAIFAGTTGTVAVFGTGPWAIVYTGAGSPAVLVPGGATVKLTVTFTTETTFASTSGVADPYTISTAVTDTTGASTTLSSIGVYETASTSVTITNPSGTLVAGTPFTVKASGTDSGLPLTVTAVGSLSNSLVTGLSATTTLSPSSFTTGTGSQSISVNDTTAETLTVTVNGGTLAGSSANGALTGSTSPTLTIVPAAVTAIAVKITIGATSYSPTGANKILNVTNALGLVPLSGGGVANYITISTADKYGNAAPYGTAETITVSANTLAGQTTGFSTQSVYQTGGAYPYAPTGGVVPTVPVTIGALASSVTLNSTTYFFFGVDYGSSSYITASSSASGLTSGSSSKINTYTLGATALTITPSSTTPKAGKTITLTATMANPQQANVPVNFANATDTVGLFSNGLTAINSTMTVASGAASAVVTFTPSTKAGATVSFIGKDALPGTNGKFAYNTATGSSGTITTVAGSATNLAIATYFDSAIHNPSSMTTAKGQLYVDANTTDAYGNPAPVSTATQVTLSTSGGGLSQSIVWITSGQHDTAGSGYAVLFTPASSGTSFTISGSATVGSSVLSGSATVTVVSATPTLTLTSPATITSGVPSTINGTAKVSPGVSVSGAPGYIKGIQYSLNGAANVTVVNGTSSSTKLTFQFTLLLSGANNIIVWTEDSAGNWVSAIAQVPVIAPGLTFTSSGTGQPAQYQFPNGGPQSVSTTFTNNGATSLTIIVIANIFTSPGGLPVTPSPTATATVAAGATATVYNLLNGLPHGTYTVTVNVYSASYVSLSPTYTVTVTV